MDGGCFFEQRLSRAMHKQENGRFGAVEVGMYERSLANESVHMLEVLENKKGINIA